MTERIREFTIEDYPGIVSVQNAVDPEHPQSVMTWRRADETSSANIDRSRWVHEEEGRILAFATLCRMTWMYHPRKYYFSIMVEPGARCRGIGGGLFGTVEAAARRREALSLRCYTSEAWPAGIRFLKSLDFVEGPREQESAIDLTGFDPLRFGEDLQRVEAADEVKLLNYVELSADPDRDRKLYELDAIVGPDMPSPEPITLPGFEDYRAQIFEHPHLFPEGFLIAVDGDGGYVGLSNLWLRNKPDSLATGFTGVMRECRGKGIATALKVKALSVAKAAGYSEIITSNDSTNAGMLGINRRLGFEPRPAWIDYTLDLTEQAAGKE